MFSLRFNLAILSCVIFVIFISTYFHYDFPLPQLLTGLHDNQNGLIFSRSILGVIASGDGTGGEVSDDTEKAEVNFTSNCCHGDSFSATKVGNGTASWWQVEGFATANNHMSFA